LWCRRLTVRGETPTRVAMALWDRDCVVRRQICARRAGFMPRF
jgi:hypothetical protein